jgi:hypothetical protein
MRASEGVYVAKHIINELREGCIAILGDRGITEENGKCPVCNTQYTINRKITFKV